MKTLLLLTLMALALPHKSYAVVLFCSGGDGSAQQVNVESINYQNLLVEKVGGANTNYDCKVIKIAPKIENGEISEFVSTDTTSLKIRGMGIGFRMAVAEGFMINCPLITKIDNIYKFPFYGIKLTAAAGVGASVGVFSNKRGGVCLLTSLQGAAIGVGVSGAKMTFE